MSPARSQRTDRRRRRLGNALLAAALPVAALSIVAGPAGAITGEFRESDPSSLSVALSRAAVPDNQAQAFFIAREGDPSILAGVGAALGAVPGPTSLLLVPAGPLSGAVLAEVDRIRNDQTLAYVVVDEAIAAALDARGVATNLVTGETPTQVAVALADQTFGVPAGTSQRLFVTRGDLRVAGLANAAAVNLGIPVIPVQGSWTGEALVREVVVVADPAIVGDADVAGQPGGPTVTRVWDADLDALGELLGGVLADDPLDGFLEGRVGTATIIIDDDEDDPHPALLASVVAAAYALDGLDATVRVLGRDMVLPESQPTTRIGLAGTAVPPPPAAPPPAPSPPGPLPVTGGGLVLAAVLALSGGLLRRQ